MTLEFLILDLIAGAALAGQPLSRRDIATDMGARQKDVVAALKALEAAGHVTVEKGARGFYRFRIGTPSGLITGWASETPRKPGRPVGKRRRASCMTCGRRFLSEGRHNHVCPACTRSTLWKGGQDYLTEVLV